MKEAVAKFIREQSLLSAGERVGVAVSGGADSVALLRVLLELRRELGIVLAVVHFNHCIRGAESDADERFVRELAEKSGVLLHAGAAAVPAYAGEHGLSIESAGRKLRYEYFATLFRSSGTGSLATLDKIATAHTQNDQAETVLMRLLRGAGTRGLSGIHSSLADLSAVSSTSAAALGPNSATPRIIRPLLALTRHQVIEYLHSVNQAWREDSSNLDLGHLRNRVRHELLPLLERDFNPAIIRVLAEHAQLSQGEEEFWSSHLEQVLPMVYKQDGGALKVQELLRLPLAAQRRVIRAAAEHSELTLDFEHIEAIRRLAGTEVGLRPKRLTLPGGEAELALRHGLRELALSRGCLNKTAQEYEYALPVPGAVAVPEIDRYFRARLITVQEAMQQGGKIAFQGYNQPQLVDVRHVSSGLLVRNWRPGDRFCPAHTKSPKKIKELLQSKRATERKSWPVVSSGNQILWMRGFLASASFSLPTNAPASEQGLLIEELESSDL